MTHQKISMIHLHGHCRNCHNLATNYEAVRENRREAFICPCAPQSA